MMNALFKSLLTVGALVFATQAAAQIKFYEQENFGGRSFTADRQVGDFSRIGFNDRARSVEVISDRWEVCEDAGFVGRCVVLRPGRYASLASMGLNDRVSSVRDISRGARVDDNRYAPPPQSGAQAQITFYEHEGFQGRSFSADRRIDNFDRFGFNDRASSVVVTGDRWEVCEDAGFAGRCMVLRPGEYASLASMGMNRRISSVRDVSRTARFDDNRYAPPAYDRERERERERERGEYRRRD